MLKRIIKKLFRSKRKEVITLSKNDVVLDFGNNLIKVCSSNKKISFLSKIRKASESETVMQRNAIKFHNGYNYIIGDNKAQLTKANRKIDREYARELIIYSIANLDVNNQANFEVIEGITTINLYMLLPLPQLYTEPLFRELLEGQEFNIRINNIDKTYKINLIQCVAEGKMVINNIDTNTMRTDILIFDIGGRTNDIFWFDSELNEVGKCSYPKGIQNITAKYMNVVQANSLIHMEKRLNKGNFTKEEFKLMEEVDHVFFDEIIKFTKDNIMCDLLEEDTTIIFVGGGSVALKKAIRNYFKDTKYDIRFLEDEESVFANAIGYQRYIADNKPYIEEYYANIKNCKIEKVSNDEEEEKENFKNGEVEKMEKRVLKVINCDEIYPTTTLFFPWEKEIGNTGKDRENYSFSKGREKINSKRITGKKERLENCKKLHEEGKDINEIMEILQVSKKTISNYFKELEIV